MQSISPKVISKIISGQKEAGRHVKSLIIYHDQIPTFASFTFAHGTFADTHCDSVRQHLQMNMASSMGENRMAKTKAGTGPC